MQSYLARQIGKWTLWLPLWTTETFRSPTVIDFLTPVGLTLSFEYPVQNITERKMSEAVPEPVA